MFGLWRKTSEEWVILSEFARFVDDLELRIRYVSCFVRNTTTLFHVQSAACEICIGPTKAHLSVATRLIYLSHSIACVE